MEWYYILLIVLGSLLAFLGLTILFYKPFFKRFFDIILSSLVLIFGAIPMAITAILVKIKLGSPVLFKQERIGKNQKVFNIYKFRTMTDARDENGKLLPDEERFTKFGKILRKTSLDELPQFINVLKGDMSLIGPRPMISIHLPSDEKVREKRFSIRPGITGAAQINGRTNITFKERFNYDVKYANNINFFVDFKIFWITVFKTIKSLFKKGGKVKSQYEFDILEGTVEYERLKNLETNN